MAKLESGIYNEGIKLIFPANIYLLKVKDRNTRKKGDFIVKKGCLYC